MEHSVQDVDELLEKSQRVSEVDPAEAPPEYTIDAAKVFQPYFQKLHQEPSEIGPEAFELLVLTWLTDIAGSDDRKLNQEPTLAWLSELTESLQQTRIEMNPMR